MQGVNQAVNCESIDLEDNAEITKLDFAKNMSHLESLKLDGTGVPLKDRLDILRLDPEKVNIYGGGISIGHPIGATGAMLTVKVMYELMRTDKKDAMISMCIGGGQGISMYFTKCE